jgi:HAD superfamily hydrolase (TIGR01509 family)
MFKNMFKEWKKFLLLLLIYDINAAKIFFDLGSVIINEYNPSLLTTLTNADNPIEGYFDYSYHIFKPFSDEINYKKFLVDNFGIEPISQRAKIIFYDLQNGTYDSEQVLKILTEKVKNTDIETEKKEYLQKLINNISFEDSVKRITIFNDVPAVMRELNKHQHQYYVLSNWSNGFKKYFFDNFDQFFKFIPEENIIISAEIKSAKPHPDFFKKVINKFNLSKEDLAQSWFIDDQPANIHTALDFGFNGIVHENWPKTLAILKDKGVI